jgi:hypothetical protein
MPVSEGRLTPVQRLQGPLPDAGADDGMRAEFLIVVSEPFPGMPPDFFCIFRLFPIFGVPFFIQGNFCGASFCRRFAPLCSRLSRFRASSRGLLHKIFEKKKEDFHLFWRMVTIGQNENAEFPLQRRKAGDPLSGE